MPATLLATRRTRITKLLSPVLLSPAAPAAVKVKRASAPSVPRVPLGAVRPPMVTVPAKFAVSAPPAVVIS
ncbi:hypothetical protein FQZ97_876380 [compost metagenome]